MSLQGLFDRLKDRVMGPTLREQLDVSRLQIANLEARCRRYEAELVVAADTVEQLVMRLGGKVDGA